jgi:hypothetical protein
MNAYVPPSAFEWDDAAERFVLRQRTADEAVAEADDFLRHYYPEDVKSREIVFTVVHDEQGGSWLEMGVYSTRGPEARNRRTRYRYCSRMTGPVRNLDPVPEHPRGTCGLCTLRWRYYNGLGLAIDDVADVPSYLRDDQMPDYGTLIGLPVKVDAPEFDLLGDIAKNTVTRRGRKVRAMK